jgi:hypothetical protein
MNTGDPNDFILEEGKTYDWAMSYKEELGFKNMH